MGIGKSCKCFKVVTFNEYMVGSIGIFADNRFRCVLYQHRQLFAQAFLHIFGLIFPHQSISLLFAQQPQQLRLFFISQPIKL